MERVHRDESLDGSRGKPLVILKCAIFPNYFRFSNLLRSLAGSLGRFFHFSAIYFGAKECPNSASANLLRK